MNLTAARTDRDQDREMRRTARRFAGIALVGASLVVGSAVPAFGAARPSARAEAKLNCTLVSPAKLSSLSGVTVTKVSTTVVGSTTTCFYSGKSGSPILQYSTGITLKTYNAAVVGDIAHHESTTVIKGYGNAAVEITVGKIVAGFMLIKGTRMFLVSAIAPLPNLEKVAKYVLPSL